MYEITNIERVRRTLHQTQQQFSKLLGISVSALCCYENRQRAPSAKTLKALSKFLTQQQPSLNITIEQILHDYD